MLEGRQHASASKINLISTLERLIPCEDNIALLLALAGYLAQKDHQWLSMTIYL